MEEHLSQEELASRLTTAATQVNVTAMYRHYKGGLYVVRDVALLETTNEACVVYQAEYGEKLTFIRPVSNWLEDVVWQGRSVKRFTPVEG